MTIKQIEKKRHKEKKVVALMIRVYCNKNHGTRGENLCQECAELTTYAYGRADACPHMAEKTFCSSCKTHCYKPEMREKIRKVMRYSGPRMAIYYPSMALRHSLEEKKEKISNK